MLVYALLGLVAFFAPRYVHNAKELLDALDAISYAPLIVSLIVRLPVYAINFEIAKLAEENISLFIFLLQDFLEGLMCQSIYLIFANISRYLWFGRISLERILACIIQLLSAALLLPMFSSVR